MVRGIIILLIVILCSASVQAVDVEVRNLACALENITEIVAIEKGEAIHPGIHFKANQDAELQLILELSGHGNNISRIIRNLDIEDGAFYIEDYTLNIPKDLETGEYLLRFDLYAENELKTCYQRFHIVPPRHEVQVKDITFPESAQAGRTLEVRALVENMGKKTESPVTATMSIPSLEIAESTILYDLEPEQIEEVSAYISLPECIGTGTYTLHARLGYGEDTRTIQRPILIQDECHDEVEKSDDLVVVVQEKALPPTSGSAEQALRDEELVTRFEWIVTSTFLIFGIFLLMILLIWVSPGSRR